MAEGDLPEFDQPQKVYFLKGKTLNTMLLHIRTNRPCGTAEGGVMVDAETNDGTFLSPDIGAGGGGGDQDDLPEKFDESKVYALRPDTFQTFVATVRTNQTKATTPEAVDSDYLNVDSQGSDGLVLSYYAGS